MAKNEFDMNLLRTLEILFEEGSVSRSAVRMGISQAAVSVQLAKLRAHFDDPLFIPSRNGLAPTAFARMLASPLNDLMQRSRSVLARRQSFDPATARRRFRISAGYIDTAIIFSTVSQRLFEQAPGISASYLDVDLGSKEAEFRVLPAGLDLPTRGLHSTPLYTDRYVCLVDRNHSGFGEQLSEDEYFEATHIVRRFGLTGPASLEAHLMEKMGRQRKEGPIIDNYAIIPSLLIGTNYVSTVASRFAQFLAERFPLRILELPIPFPHQTMMLLWESLLEDDMAALWLRNLICETARQTYGPLPDELMAQSLVQAGNQQGQAAAPSLEP